MSTPTDMADATNATTDGETIVTEIHDEGQTLARALADLDRAKGAVRAAAARAVRAAARAGEPPALLGVALIAAERSRQLLVEGWTTAHDDRRTHGALAEAACVYTQRAIASHYPVESLTYRDVRTGTPPLGWPWDADWWKPSDDPIRNLTKAGALIAAEIDRIARARAARVAQEGAR